MFLVIEVCSREYGDFSEKMATVMDNGKCLRWFKDNSETRKHIVRRASQYDEISNHLYDFSSSGWFQFNVLFMRMLKQQKRNYVSNPQHRQKLGYLKIPLKNYFILFLGLLIIKIVYVHIYYKIG